jgi:Fic family protein
MVGLQLESEPVTTVLARLDKRADKVRLLMEAASPEEIAGLWAQLDLSGIYHDCALEGQVVSPEELTAAFDDTSLKEATSLPVFATLRAHKQAYDTIRELAGRRRLDLSLDLFKQFHAMFASNPEEAKAGRYRKDIPLHRSYFHEINEPQKIGSNMRQLINWVNSPDEAENVHPINWAARFHFQFMRIFPFTETSGKVGRAVMNLILVRQGYLPAVIHATERQRYYEALRQHQQALTDLVVDSELAALDAAVRYLERGPNG